MTTNSDRPCTLMTPGQSEDAAVQLEHEFTRIVQDEIGMHDQLAALFAQALVRGLRRLRGGEDIYVPASDRSGRDAAIRAEFMGGSNLREVMRKYDVSRSTVYRIVGQRDPMAGRLGDPA